MKNKVVYTALTGGYDKLIQHQFVNPEYDYICFSNDFNVSRVGIWEIRPIPFETHDVQRLSRFPKLQPHLVLPEYDYSLYVDANIDICTSTVFGNIERLIKEDVELAGLKHQTRHCLYKESFMVLLRGLDKNKKRVIEQMKLYVEKGFPFDFGMYEANVIFRKHNSQMLKQINDEWWYWQQNYSRRDQLSYAFCLWKYQMPFHYLLPENEWSKNSNSLKLVKHKKQQSVMNNCIFEWFRIKLLAIQMRLLFPIYKMYICG